jgi:hypothetical protein
MTEFKEEIPINITEYLQRKMNDSIKNILSLLDSSDISIKHKKIVRKEVLNSLNDFYIASCRVLTYIQEQEGKVGQSRNI